MFELTTPWALIALPLPLLVWFLLPRLSLQLSMALKVPFYDAMSRLVDKEKRWFTKEPKMIVLFICWSLLVIALAGPCFVGAPRSLARENYNIMMALDVSPSMDVQDMAFSGHYVTRLSVVKRAAKQFVEQRVGDKIGLILFGERAYLLTPLTYDRHNVLERLEDASVGLAGKSTSIGDALGLAIKRLQHVPKSGRMIILLTDGVSNSGILSPLKAAAIARTDDIKIYTIGLGAQLDPNAFDGMFLNMNGSADLDEETLKAVSKITGGHYFRATDMQSLQHIYTLIDKMTRVSEEKATFIPRHEYYPWPLALALLLLIYVLLERSGLLMSLFTSPIEEQV